MTEERTRKIYPQDFTYYKPKKVKVAIQLDEHISNHMANETRASVNPLVTGMDPDKETPALQLQLCQKEIERLKRGHNAWDNIFNGYLKLFERPSWESGNKKKCEFIQRTLTFQRCLIENNFSQDNVFESFETMSAIQALRQTKAGLINVNTAWRDAHYKFLGLITDKQKLRSLWACLKRHSLASRNGFVNDAIFLGEPDEQIYDLTEHFVNSPFHGGLQKGAPDDELRDLFMIFMVECLWERVTGLLPNRNGQRDIWAFRKNRIGLIMKGMKKYLSLYSDEPWIFGDKTPNFYDTKKHAELSRNILNDLEIQLSEWFDDPEYDKNVALTYKIAAYFWNLECDDNSSKHGADTFKSTFRRARKTWAWEAYACLVESKSSLTKNFLET